jgi:hypothetical protein
MAASALIWNLPRHHTRVNLKLALIGLAIMLSPVVVEYLLAHRKLYPTEKEGRITSIVGMILASPAAIQAYRTLSRNLLSTFHPLAVSSALFSGDSGRQFATGVVRDTRHPTPLRPGDRHGDRTTPDADPAGHPGGADQTTLDHRPIPATTLRVAIPRYHVST